MSKKYLTWYSALMETVVLLFLCSSVYSQTRRSLSGLVIDLNGSPLEGVTIQVKGENTHVLTNANGKFTIVANTNDSLLFKFVGYVNKIVPADPDSVKIVQMVAGLNALNDVVIIGYGSKRKDQLTGTVVSLDGSDIVASKATNATEAMQGRLQGVDIKRSSGKPGADFSIEIRGQNSIYGNTQPLYVIDGVAVTNNVNNPINDINPADIERIDVLKDAASTAIYGSRGANGVVLVTTKKGSSGEPKISYDAYVGLVNAYHLPPTMDGPAFVNYVRDYYNEQAQAAALLNNQPPPTGTIDDDKLFSATELKNIANGTYTNWPDLIKQNGISTNHNINISGGNSKTLYYASVGYQLYEGAVKNESVKKYTLKIGLDETLNKTFKFGASLYGVYNDLKPGSGEMFRSAYRLRPTGSAYNEDGSQRFFPSEGESQITNPLFELSNELRSQQYLRMMGNLYAQITFLKGLSLRSSFTPDITFQRTGVYSGQFTKANAGSKPASASNGKNNYLNYNFTNLLTYGNKIGRSVFDITLGAEYNYYQQDYSGIDVKGLPYKSLWFNVASVVPITINGITIPPSISVSSGYSQQNMSSYFSRVNYTFNDRYLFTATVRADGNSIFAAGNKWGYFPSAAFGWIMSKENFLKNVSWINFLKLRLSAGKVGNAASASPYITQQSISQTQYNFGSENANGFGLTGVLANKALTWEKTDEYDASVDLRIFKNRLALQLDYYRKTVNGAIQNIQIPPTNGYTSTVINLGKVRNSGIEIGLTSTNINSKDFKWTTSINFSKNNNKILDLTGDGLNNVGNQKFIGQKARVVYGYKIIGVWQLDEAAEAAKYGQIPGQYKIQDITTSGLSTAKPTAPDLNPDGKINANDYQILGSDIPEWFGGISNNFTYRNFDFSVMVYTRQGTFEQSTFLVQVMDGDQGRARFNAFDRPYWTPENPNNRWANEARETDGARRGIAEFSNSSYTKISNITLGYTLPANMINRLGINRVRFYLCATNPFIFTKFVGWDPEIASANSYANAEFRTRTFMFGVNLTL